MANNVIGSALSGTKQVFDNVETVADVQKSLKLEGNFTAMINGEPANSSDELDDGDVVSFAQAAKGGLI